MPKIGLNDLPDEIREKIFTFLVREEGSFWPILNELQLTCKNWQLDFENPALYKWLTLDEEIILHVKRSHEENDESIQKEILRWSTDTKYLKLENFRHYFNKILLMMIEYSSDMNLETLEVRSTSGGYIFEEWTHFINCLLPI